MSDFTDLKYKENLQPLKHLYFQSTIFNFFKMHNKNKKRPKDSLDGYSSRFKEEFGNLLKPKRKYDLRPEKWNDDSLRFVYYIFNSTFNSHSFLKPVPYTYIKQYFRKANIYGLWNTGIIGSRRGIGRLMRKSDLQKLQGSKKSIEYSLRDDIRYKLYELRLEEQLRETNHRKYDSNKNPEPSIILRSYESLKTGIADEAALKLFLNEIKQKINEGTDTRADRLLLHQIYNALSHLKRQKYNQGDNSYISAYQTCRTGRIFQRKGGLQGAKREIKEIAYSNLHDVHNYDLKSSQPSILEEEMEKAGSKHEYISNYLGTKEAKEVFAEKIGVSPDCWKQVLYLVTFGGLLNYHPSCDFYDVINENIKKTDRDTVISRFKKELRPLQEEYCAYWNHLYDTHFTRNTSGKVIKNACGKPFIYDQSWKDLKIKRKLTAHILQGIESSFIHNLTILSSKYNFQVLSNEHDGLITKGEIPDVAIEEAKKITGFYNAKLVIKPYADTFVVN
jgi:hypothetical protein